MMDIIDERSFASYITNGLVTNGSNDKDYSVIPQWIKQDKGEIEVQDNSEPENNTEVFDDETSTEDNAELQNVKNSSKETEEPSDDSKETAEIDSEDSKDQQKDEQPTETKKSAKKTKKKKVDSVVHMVNVGEYVMHDNESTVKDSFKNLFKKVIYNIAKDGVGKTKDKMPSELVRIDNDKLVIDLSEIIDTSETISFNSLFAEIYNSFNIAIIEINNDAEDLKEVKFYDRSNSADFVLKAHIYADDSDLPISFDVKNFDIRKCKSMKTLFGDKLSKIPASMFMGCSYWKVNNVLNMERMFVGIKKEDKRKFVESLWDIWFINDDMKVPVKKGLIKKSETTETIGKLFGTSNKVHSLKDVIKLKNKYVSNYFFGNLDESEFDFSAIDKLSFKDFILEKVETRVPNIFIHELEDSTLNTIVKDLRTKGYDSNKVAIKDKEDLFKFAKRISTNLHSIDSNLIDKKYALVYAPEFIKFMESDVKNTILPQLDGYKTKYASSSDYEQERLDSINNAEDNIDKFWKFTNDANYEKFESAWRKAFGTSKIAKALTMGLSKKISNWMSDVKGADGCFIVFEVGENKCDYIGVTTINQLYTKMKNS